MRENALRCIANTHKEEGSDRPDGGWQQWPKDRGNWVDGVNYGTKFGIAAHTAKIRGIHPSKIKSLTRAEADALYMAYEWPRSYGDLWPMGFDQLSYDACVNSGPGRGALWTCKGLGFANDKPSTVQAAAAKAHALSTEAKVAAAKRTAAIRLSFLRGLRDWQHFGKGWGGRVQRMEAIAVRMILEFAATGVPGPSAKPSPSVQKRLEAEAGDASKKANTAAASGTATAGGAGASTETETVSSFDWTAWLLAGGLVLIVVGVCAWIWWKHRERAKAYLDAARGLIG